MMLPRGNSTKKAENSMAWRNCATCQNALELTDKRVKIDIAHRLLPRGNGKAD